MKTVSTKQTILIGMCTAILSVLAQVSIPLPSGVPVTLQTFGVALIAYFLGTLNGTISTVIYILLGMMGVPVFTNFKGGISAILGKTGGFLIGFILMAFLCGLGQTLSSNMRNKHYSNNTMKLIATFSPLILFSLLGLFCCHLLGILQFKLLTHMTFTASALCVSIPFLWKDIIIKFL